MGSVQRRAVQARVLADGGRLARRIADALQREIPAYASLGEAQRRETEAISLWGVQRLLELWVEDGRLGDADLRQFHGIGVARGTDGRPLSAVLRAYRVAAVEASGLVRDSGVAELDVEDVLAMNVVLLESLDALSEALSAGYAAATERLTTDRDEVVRALTQDLLAGRQTSAAALADRTRLLDLTLPARLAMTVVGAPGSDVTAGDVAQLLASADTDGLVLSTTRQGVGVVLHERPLDLGVDVRSRGRRTCRIDDVALTDLPATFRLAEVAVRHAPLDLDSTPVMVEADALLVALLHGQPPVDPRTLAEAALRPLLEPDQAHLLAGLRAFLEHGSAVAAAEVLGLHPQSMRYRLRRVRESTGRDLGSAWDRLLLATAVAVLSLQP
ncbi:PucR family transcriptional regulator [Aeromicrobium sp.]|uniref:PucR family transcriptional regulator n=1 Tax=Aeromicrobium sp. TaxID=1871063 RepID=UPI0035115700